MPWWIASWNLHLEVGQLKYYIFESSTKPKPWRFVVKWDSLWRRALKTKEECGKQKIMELQKGMGI